MKNQYFGDIIDYIKYGLIRTLTNTREIKTTICWMLTKDDDGGDGQFIDYLQQPEKWRFYDPPFFDQVVGKRTPIVLNRPWIVLGRMQSSGGLHREMLMNYWNFQKSYP